ncbi:MAG: PH domain-containing protein [Clostridia bacterium]|nr:PH domain-containing protein [Clostridia bacterium]
MAEKNIVWSDRKRWLFGLPWSFTRYRLYEDKFVIDKGFFTRHEDEIRLYRILDISLTRTFGERLFGLGTIHCCSGDKTSPEFDIKRIKRSRELKDILSDMIEEEREKRRVGTREYIDGDDGFDDGDDGHFN